MKKIKLIPQMLIVAIVVPLLLTSCHNYYKASSTSFKNDTEKAANIDKLQLANKTFVLRYGSEAFCMNNIVLNPEHTILECTLDSLSFVNKLHLTKGKKGNMQYKKNWPEHNAVLNEVHVYVAQDGKAAMGKYTLALDKIQKVEVIEKDKNRTTGSYVFGGIAYTAGIVLTALVVYAAAGGLEWNMGR